MKITVEFQTYPDDTAKQPEKVIVKNHWNMTDRVHIQIGDQEHIVLADDLKRAIQSVTNHRF